MKIKNILTTAMLLATIMIAGISIVGAFPTEVRACNTPDLGCHVYPPTSINVTADVTTTLTVSPGQSFIVNVTWKGGSTEAQTVAKWPTDFSTIGIVRNNSLFNPTPIMSPDLSGVVNTSGTLMSVLTAPNTPGVTHMLRVHASTGNGGNIPDHETDFKDITVIVQASQPPSFNISGFKINNDTGLGVQGWNVMLSNNTMTANATTDMNGMYNFMGLANGSYNVTEQTLAGWTPVGATTLTVTINGADMENQNFTNIPPSVTVTPSFNISGFKINNDTGLGVQGWNIMLSNNTMTANATTDMNGMYNFMDLANGSYNVTEQTLAGWTPVGATTLTVAINGADMENQNFTNIPPVTPVLTKIIISQITIVVGTNVIFGAQAFDQFNNSINVILTWNSSNTTVGTIDANTGTFVAKAPGITTVTATNGSIVGSTNVTVISSSTPMLKTITVSPATAKIAINGTQVFTATALDQSNISMAGVNISWASNNTPVGNVSPATATTDASGNAITTFTANAEGVAMVTATNGIVVGSANVTVAVAAVTPKLTLTLNTTMDGTNNTLVNNITSAVLLDTLGNILATATFPDNMTAQFSLSGISPGDYFIEVNNHTAALVPTRIDNNISDINQIVGLRMRNSVIGNISNPTYRIKSYPSEIASSHPVVNYVTGLNESKFAFVIVSGSISKIEVRVLNTSEELSNFSTDLTTHDSQSVSFQTWILGDIRDPVTGAFIGNHGHLGNSTDNSRCTGCHPNLDSKPDNFPPITGIGNPGWCFRCHYGSGGPRNGFVDPKVQVQVANGTIAGTVTNVSGLGIAGATVTAGTQSNITDLNGNYSISIVPGTYSVAASATGFQTNTTTNVVVTSGNVTTQNFVLELGVPTNLTIAVSPPTASLTVSGTQMFNATAMDQNNNPMPGIIITWASNNVTVGTVAPLTATTGANGNASATFTAAAAGVAMVTATNGTEVGSANVTVTVPLRVTSFLLTPDTSVVLKGTTININVMALSDSLPQQLFNGMANITITANNMSQVTFDQTATFVNGNATIQVNSSIAQFVNVTATNGNITGSTMVEFADMVISLDRGYNLISIPSFANPSDITQAMQLVQNNGVQTFNPATGMFVTPTDLRPLFGYWINVTADNQKLGFIADTNVVIVPPTRNLFEGWNLIGVSASRNDAVGTTRIDMTANATFVDLRNGELPSQWLYSRLTSFDGATPQTFTAGMDLTLDSPPLKQGHGYWLFIKGMSNTNKNNVPWAGKLW
jgi:hypothetical protein